MTALFRARHLFTATLLALGVAAPAFSAWQTARLLNLPGESDVKTARVAAAKSGGFHVMYSNANPWQVRYRRWKDGAFIRDAYLKNVFCPNGDIAEAGNGDVHVVWEDWDGSEQIGWGKSTDGGQTWLVRDATAYSNDPDGEAKHPGVAAWGPGDSANIMVSSWNAVDKGIYYNLMTNPSNPAPGNAPTGFTGDNQYAVNGMCRSLQDGSVYRLMSRNIGGTISVVMRRFNPGTQTWEPETVVAQPGFFARESIAVNPIGQIMCVWEKDDHLWYRLYTPGTGWGAVTDLGEGHFAWVIAVPTTSDFYMTYTIQAQDRCLGRRYSGGGWLPPELVSTGMQNGFTPDTHCAAGPDGTIYAVWEYWGASNGQWHDKPQQWFNILPGAGGATGTLSGVVRDQLGQGISGATVGAGAFATISGAGGAYSLNLPAGSQNVTAYKQFYTSQTINGILITQGQTTHQDFVIQGNPPAPVTNFYATPSAGLNRLFWTNPVSPNFLGTMIRYKTTGYPTSATDGALVTDQPGAAGSNGSFTHSGLTNGVTYYYSAFAHDDAGHYASAAHALGKPSLQLIGQAKQYPDGSIVDLNNKVVTAKFASEGAFYIEEPDRSSGIRVLGSTTANIGDRVSLSGGQMDTRVLSSKSAERQVKLATVSATVAGQPLPPLGLSSVQIGGESAGPLVPGVIDGLGLNNIGLLVRYCGRVMTRISSSLFVDDGGNIMDPAGYTGVLVKCPNAMPPVSVGDLVSVTGIVVGSVQTGEDLNRRQIQIRDYSDLVVLD